MGQFCVQINTLEGVLVGNVAFDLLPVHTEGWIGEHVVELTGEEVIVGESITELDLADILTLDQDMSDGVDICVGDKVIARGELTSGDDTDNRLCVRILGPASTS